VSGIVIFGCKSTSRYLFEQLRCVCDISLIVTIAPAKGAQQRVADYDDLGDLSGEVELYSAERYALDGPADQQFFAGRAFGIGFAMGWQRLIPPHVLERFQRGVFGMHGSSRDLPFGRGRSPLNWSILEDRRWFYTNLFRYLPGADDGPIAGTACFSIQSADTAETLHLKNLLAMVDLVKKHLPLLLSGKQELRDQPPGEPTYYPKREPADNLIDWTADLFAIERHIRAVADPFGGAFTFLNGKRLTIHRAAILYTDLEQHPFLSAAPGTVCALFANGKFCARCEGGVLLVHSHEIEGGASLSAGDVLQSPEGAIRSFARNRHGGFDMPA
jgi:UDP-4-amino-4-deoxy-L-arabinose formyltransferase/UDP-glucuronic acid dehydrogenase (UDP-4-keto-hexauronic acid decarboxylating)